MTLALLSPSQLVDYLAVNNIPEEWIPWQLACGSNPTSFKPADNPLTWLRTVRAVRKKAANIFRRETSPFAAYLLAESFGGGNKGIHPGDVIILVNAVEPDTFPAWDVDVAEDPRDDHPAVSYLRNMVAAGHAYNLFCQAFHRCYFFSPWIEFVSTWMDAQRPTSAEPDLIGNERIYMVHMVITVFLLRELNEGAVSLAVLVFMSQWAGCAPHPELSSALDLADKITQHHVVVAPESDLISRSPLWTFVMPTRDAHFVRTEGYNEWAKAKRNLPHGDYMTLVHVADTRLDAFPDSDTTQIFPECTYTYEVTYPFAGPSERPRLH
ncbi:hypothetical protein B484DRAFT_394073 [Ochromonadaceae sp. CCMP2298]|nr:hypothetical protein B484DRAFT_394073 [Ochromonadaceae sp. CCMP2298]